MSQPILRDMDGRLLTEIFDKYWISDNPPKYVNADIEQTQTVPSSDQGTSFEETEKIRERLKGLGYIN